MKTEIWIFIVIIVVSIFCFFVSKFSTKKKSEIKITTTAKSRVDDFINLVKKISGNNDIYVSGEITSTGRYERFNLNNWPSNEPVTNISDICLFVEGPVPDVKKGIYFNKCLSVEWEGKVNVSDEYYSKNFEYAFAKGFPNLEITVNKRSLARKAKEFASLYKKEFGGNSKIIIND